jgi:hypothetical protein
MVTIEGNWAYINGETACNITHFAEYIETKLINYFEAMPVDTDDNDYKTLVTEVFNIITSRF